jgi:hypothetical protein
MGSRFKRAKSEGKMHAYLLRGILLDLAIEFLYIVGPLAAVSLFTWKIKQSKMSDTIMRSMSSTLSVK